MKVRKNLKQKHKKKIIHHKNKKNASYKEKQKSGLKISKLSRKLNSLPLRERMLEKLKTSRFRYINEELYTMKSHDAFKRFKEDPEAFKTYHKGYQQQVQQWPVNPLNIVIKNLKKLLKKDTVVADFGCGTAELAKAFPETKIYSFDLVGLDSLVTVCDMANTPLASQSVDIAVFCLSLMGTNFSEFIVEANRVLKNGGILIIAEVESRFENVDNFVQTMMAYGFKNTSVNFDYDLFYFMNFTKERVIGKKGKKKLPELILKACLYKKR